MYFLVPSAHLAFITAPMTQTWLCSIPAPHQYSVGEQSNDYCCRSPRTPGNMAAGSLCSKLEIASRGPDTFLYFSEEKKPKGKPVARHLYHYEVMSPETLIYVLCQS